MSMYGVVLCVVQAGNTELAKIEDAALLQRAKSLLPAEARAVSFQQFSVLCANIIF